MPDQPRIQVRTIRCVARAQRPVVAVPAFNRTRDCTRTDPRAQGLRGAISAPVALAGGLAAGLRGFGGINALEADPLAGHLQGVGIDDPRGIVSDFNGDFADALLRRLGWASGRRLHGPARAGAWPVPMTMPRAVDLAPLGTIGAAIVTAIGRHVARMGKS